MMRLRPRSMLFTLFGDYAHPLGDDALWVGALIRLAAEFGISGGSLRSAVSRMAREGWLAGRMVAGRSSYALTPRGHQLIEEGTRRIYRTRRDEWDGQWLLVAYSGATARPVRDRLRTELTFLGFGALGAGLYVSPHDLRAEVAELARRHGVQDGLTSLRGFLAAPSGAGQVVRRAWDLAGLALRYRDFISSTEKDRRRDSAMAQAGKLDPATAFRRRFVLTHRYRRFPYTDPDLPLPLQPAGWPGTQAHELFLEYNALLRPAAEEHYRAVAGAANSGRAAGSMT